MYIYIYIYAYIYIYIEREREIYNGLRSCGEGNNSSPREVASDRVARGTTRAHERWPQIVWRGEQLEPMRGGPIVAPKRDVGRLLSIASGPFLLLGAPWIPTLA